MEDGIKWKLISVQESCLFTQTYRIPELLNRIANGFPGPIRRTRSSRKCFKYGKSSHFANQCYATTHDNGSKRWEGSNPDSSDDSNLSSG